MTYIRIHRRKEADAKKCSYKAGYYSYKSHLGYIGPKTPRAVEHCTWINIFVSINQLHLYEALLVIVVSSLTNPGILKHGLN